MSIKDTIQSYSPLNTKEKIDLLVMALKEMPGAMNPMTRINILSNIQKAKMQMYFNDTYPESTFTDAVLPQTTYRDNRNQVKSSTVVRESDEKYMIPVPDETLGSKKFIYGTYIEMAFHNFFLNMQHIHAVVFGEDIMDEAKRRFELDEARKIDIERKQWDGDFANEKYVWNTMFEKMTKAHPEERQKAEELISRHFPIMVAIKDFTTGSRQYKQINTIGILKRMSRTMRVLRNVFSHYKINLWENQYRSYVENEDFVNGVLQHAFLVSKRIVKSRFALDNNAMQCAEQYRFRIDPSQRDQYGKPKKVKEEIPGYRYKLCDAQSHLTSFGLVFLTSLFLEKKYSKILTDKLYCIPAKDQSVVNELIAVYRIRLNSEKFHVTKDVDALALDILTELRKCPKELFELLSPEDQKKFRVPVSDENTEDVLMLRHSDRFTHLLLKYIDDTGIFDSIRFQVSLGKYFYKFYDKFCIDNAGEPRVRALSKGLNGFGRISEIEEARRSKWDSEIREYDDVHKNTSNEEPYVTDHHARYVVNGNRIAMRIFDSSPRRYLPELTTDGAQNLVPTCWMSIYELPAMAFLIHLRGGSYVEEIIKSTVANYRRLFADVAESRLLPVESEPALQERLNSDYEGIRICDLPEDMVDYLSGRTKDAVSTFQKRSDKLIDLLIEQTRYKMAQFAEQRKLVRNPKMNKLGKKNYVSIQPGKLAAFLAKDIMYFQPNNPENKNKLTSLNYRILQSSLALYSKGDTDNMRRTLESAHILGNANDSMCNPIVTRLWNKRIKPGNIQDFYRDYLEERLTYLQECKQKPYGELAFLHSDRLRWQEHDEDFYRAKAGRYIHENMHERDLEKAIELPRGMFEKYIREELGAMSAVKNIASDASKNISYLIYGYFRNVMLDDSQSIYEARRTYPILNALYRSSPRDPQVYYSTHQIREGLMKGHADSIQLRIGTYLQGKDSEEKERISRLLKNMKNNETLLKRYKVQDMLLFLMAKKILLADNSDSERCVAINRIHLKDIQEKDVLSQKIKFSVQVQSRKGCNKIISQDDLKLKNYAQFYRFLYDRRLPGLLDLIQAVQISRSSIEEELAGYDKVHPSVLEQVFAYEKEYIDAYGASDLEFPKMVRNDSSFDDAEKNTLSRIRNSFAHYSYPKYHEIGSTAQRENLPKKAIAISDTFNDTIKRRNQDKQ